MNVLKFSEVQFRTHVENQLLDEIDPDVPLRGRLASEVRVGAFTLDLLAENVKQGLTIVEFKVNAWKGTLAQLLLYPRALKLALADYCPPLRVVLVTTHLDRGVVELAESLSPPCPISFRVCSPDGRHLRTPSELPQQFWDQARVGGSEVEWRDGLIVKGVRW